MDIDRIDNMLWLKSLVIVLGILIVLGTFLLGYGFYKKTSEPGWKPFSEQAAHVLEQKLAPIPQRKNKTPNKPFGTLSLDLAEGCLIIEVQPMRRYAYFMIGPTPACNAIILVDIKKGVILGRIHPKL
jgi:hypothetical protein